MDRPGSARRRWGRAAAAEGRAADRLRRSGVDCRQQAGRPADGAAAATQATSRASRSSWPPICGSRGKRKPLVVHRIDRDTSGLVVFATRRGCAESAEGSVPPPRARACLPRRRLRHPVAGVGHLAGSARLGPGGVDPERDAPARSTRQGRGQRLSGGRALPGARRSSKCGSRPENGTRSGCRPGFAGHTLVGEQRYVYGPDALRPIDFPRQALHAHRLAFRHPVTDQQLSFEAPLPADMAELHRPAFESKPAASGV